MPVKNGEKAVISAGEVNKFVYCPLQWYYIRAYGQKRLREMYREANPGKEHPSTPGFNRGKAFHGGYGRRETLKKAVLLIAALVVAALLLFLLRTTGVL